VETWKTMPIDNAALTFAPHLPCRSLPAFANVEQEQMQQSELERVKRTPAVDRETPDPDATKQAAIPAAPEQPRQSQHERVHEARRLARETSKPAASKREAKHELLHIARAGRGAHEAKHDTTHVAREGHASKHEAAHTPHGGRERHRSA
jgi:hypothetical protein